MTKNRNWQFVQVFLRRGFFALVILLALSMILIGSLRWINPLTSSIILQQNRINEHKNAQWTSFNWRPLEKISAPMELAVIAAEDQRFLHHHGLDFVEVYKSLRVNISRPRGASTITQQVAKNLFLWSGRSYPRKILEAGLAIYIDFVWGKRRVLEIYLNIAQFGPNIYGVENASKQFFGKSANQLNRHDAARLAAVLPNPNARSVAHASDTVVQRQRWILRQMRALGGEQILNELR